MFCSALIYGCSGPLGGGDGDDDDDGWKMAFWFLNELMQIGKEM